MRQHQRRNRYGTSRKERRGWRDFADCKYGCSSLPSVRASGPQPARTGCHVKFINLPYDKTDQCVLRKNAITDVNTDPRSVTTMFGVSYGFRRRSTGMYS